MKILLLMLVLVSLSFSSDALSEPSKIGPPKIAVASDQMKENLVKLVSAVSVDPVTMTFGLSWRFPF